MQEVLSREVSTSPVSEKYKAYQQVVQTVLAERALSFKTEVRVLYQSVSFLVQDSFVIALLDKSHFIRNTPHLTNDHLVTLQQFQQSGFSYQVIQYDPEQEFLDTTALTQATEELLKKL